MRTNFAVWTNSWACGLCAVAMLLLPLCSSQAQGTKKNGVEVAVELAPPTVAPGGSSIYQIAVRGDSSLDVKTPEFPTSKDFRVSEPSRSESRRFVLGGGGAQSTHEIDLQWEIVPLKSSAIEIPSFDVQVNGKNYPTGEQKLIVDVTARNGKQKSRGRQALPPGFDDDDDDLLAQLLRRGFGGMQPFGAHPPGAGARAFPKNPDEAFFIQAEVDKTEVFAGEQIIASWYIYTQGDLRDFDTIKYPSLKGFWKEDLEISTHLNFQTEVIDGVPYRKALLVSYALFPIAAGTPTIDAYQARAVVTAPNDPFGSLNGGKGYKYNKSSQSVKVTVKPVPAEGRPADFSGAVGEFQFTARVDDREVREAEPFSLKIRFEGRGNAKLINQPSFQPPEGLELYNTQSDAQFFKSGTSFREFTFVLIPRKSGIIQIPAIMVSMFNPASAQFVGRSTDPLNISVLPAAATAGAIKKKALDVSGSDSRQQPEVLPLPGVCEVRANFQPLEETELWLWIAGSSLAAVSGALLILLLQFGVPRRVDPLQQGYRRRMAKAEAAARAGEFRAVGRELLNTTAFLLDAVSSEGAAREIEVALDSLPPSIRKDVEGLVLEVVQRAQRLAFAPEHELGALIEKPQLRSEVQQAAAHLGKVLARAQTLRRETTEAVK